MSKIMVVEDDASLREIYGIRITAEGYDVVSAGDGEEALAVAVREKPDLILSDVMMPKISGFDMLDILRTTPETANIKVIMMTALSSEDQRQRGERLGADRYLVKSQVGIEDVINTIHEVLGDRATPVAEAAPVQEAAAAPAATQAPAATSAPTPESVPAPEAPAMPVAEPAPSPEVAPEVVPATVPASEAPITPNTPPENGQPTPVNPAQ
ncbi:response regulator [Candidatus Saccharibacteria bacterium]|nr:response regulator [Candidatus Saccharibacteria bacterium]